MTNMAGEQRGAASEGGRARKKRHVMRESADAAEETDGARCERQRTNNNRGRADSQHGHVQTAAKQCRQLGKKGKGYVCGNSIDAPCAQLGVLVQACSARVWVRATEGRCLASVRRTRA